MAYRDRGLRDVPARCAQHHRLDQARAEHLCSHLPPWPRDLFRTGVRGPKLRPEAIIRARLRWLPERLAQRQEGPAHRGEYQVHGKHADAEPLDRKDGPDTPRDSLRSRMGSEII